MHFFITVKTYH